MRPLSRLLSVFLALMLLAASLGTVSAGEFGAGPGQHGALTVVDWVSITVTRTDDLGVAQPGDILKFTITIERLMDGHDVKVGALGPATEADATFDDVADVILSDTKPYHAEEVEYEIRATDLGNAVSRTVPLTWQIARTIVIQTEGGSEHQHARSNSQLTGNPPSATVNVDVTKKPDVDAGGTELVLDFSGSTAPATNSAGAWSPPIASRAILVRLCLRLVKSRSPIHVAATTLASPLITTPPSWFFTPTPHRITVCPSSSSTLFTWPWAVRVSPG